VTRLYKNVPVLDSGARGATDTFVQRGLGDVLLAWESEALLALKEFGPSKFEIVVPPESILAEPPVAVVDKNTDRHGTRQAAEDYVKFLYTEQGQTIIAQHYFRPRMKSVAAKFSAQFPKLKLFTIDGAFGGWQKAQKEYFGDGGVFDEIYGAAR
jgi:sulfate transport system substrate-binding protein